MNEAVWLLLSSTGFPAQRMNTCTVICKPPSNKLTVLVCGCHRWYL